MTSTRFALYFAPDRDTALWDLGCRWLGRDPEHDCIVEQPRVRGWEAARLAAITRDARRYGWHATLKAPFALRANVEVSVLDTRLAAFCGTRTAFELPALEVARLAGFVALRPNASSRALQALADACVTEFDDLRAPLREEDVTRRRAAGLSARQTELLQQYGYPYVLDQFRFHMTLTEPMDQTAADAIVPYATAYFREALRERVWIASICLFVEPAAGADFKLVRRYAFAR